MANEWFRDPRWDESAQADFEARLLRATEGNRPQYLRIKGLSLADAGAVDGAAQLWGRVLSDYSESLDAGSAREHLADLARQTGQPDEAEQYYRTLLAERPTLNGTTGLAELSLAELLIERNDEPSRSEARQLLDMVQNRSPGLTFNNSRFRWLVAETALAAQTGELALQQQSAMAALGLVTQPPQLPRHPTVGLVDADQRTLQWLGKAASGRLHKRDAGTPPWISPSKRTSMWRRV